VRNLSKYEKALAILFLLTAPMVKPWVHGDGVGYYAWARGVLIEHSLNGEIDWQKGYENDPRRFTEPNFRQHYITPTGHLNNHFTIGPAVLWAPFLVATQGLTAIYDFWKGTHFSTDGYSKPYMIAVGVGTFFYGFLTLWISFLLARKYIAKRWAFLATLGIWLASSLPFYIYAEPSLAHVHAAFMVALFVWYWDRTREIRTWKQWLLLGAIAGLMLDTYYPAGVFLLLPALEGLQSWWSVLRTKEHRAPAALFFGHAIFVAIMVLVFIPTLLSKKFMYGSYFSSGYEVAWYWTSPAFWKVCFSSRGMFGWNPILLLSVPGLIFLGRADKLLSASLLVGLFAYTYLIGCYQFWYGTPSFGNRYMITPTVIYIFGLAGFLDWLGQRWGERRVLIPATALVGLFVAWNLGLMFQFATRLLPYSYEVTLKDAAYNQVAVVPGKAVELLKEGIGRRVLSNESNGSVDVEQAK
jgi:hypothetical protein